MRDVPQFSRKPRTQRDILGIDVRMGEDIGVHDDLRGWLPSVARKSANGAGFFRAAGYC
jgi:hypothetical protein